jgi:hypothetical protein
MKYKTNIASKVHAHNDLTRFLNLVLPQVSTYFHKNTWKRKENNELFKKDLDALQKILANDNNKIRYWFEFTENRINLVSDIRYNLLDGSNSYLTIYSNLVYTFKDFDGAKHTEIIKPVKHDLLTVEKVNQTAQAILELEEEIEILTCQINAHKASVKGLLD